MDSHSHGRLLRHVVRSTGDLAGASVTDLAAELMERLQSGAQNGSYGKFQEQHAVFDALRDAVDRALDVTTNRFAVSSTAGSMHFTRHCVERHGVPMAGATHADMGCGSINPLGRMFAHCMLGIGKAFCFELDPPQNEARALRHLTDLAAATLVAPHRAFPAIDITREQILTNIRDFDLPALLLGNRAGLSPRLVFQQRSIADTGLGDASVDVLFSNSVLEHLPDVDAVFAEWRRITKPGGFGLHGIDAADHRMYGNPAIHAVEFLTEDTTASIVHECNRLRMADFDRKFAANGFEVVLVWPGKPVAIAPELHAQFAEPWRSRTAEELGVTWAQYLVRRQ